MKELAKDWEIGGKFNKDEAPGRVVRIGGKWERRYEDGRVKVYGCMATSD